MNFFIEIKLLNKKDKVNKKHSEKYLVYMKVF